MIRCQSTWRARSPMRQKVFIIWLLTVLSAATNFFPKCGSVKMDIWSVKCVVRNSPVAPSAVFGLPLESGSGIWEWRNLSNCNTIRVHLVMGSATRFYLTSFWKPINWIASLRKYMIYEEQVFFGNVGQRVDENDCKHYMRNLGSQETKCLRCHGAEMWEDAWSGWLTASFTRIPQGPSHEGVLG